MRILLDENIPVDLAPELVGHQVDTVTGVGWAGIANGKLLARASGRYDAFITMDRNIAYQQNVPMLPFGVLVLRAPSNRLVHLRPLVPPLLSALATLAPGQLRHVGA
ncbi:MAG TPA: DUF5615 family PIN-like protein [Bryobacterales bacterium]|nr:DUF5615 family PIN-like protein [Bryobacterales bacterium]